MGKVNGMSALCLALTPLLQSSLQKNNSEMAFLIQNDYLFPASYVFNLASLVQFSTLFEKWPQLLHRGKEWLSHVCTDLRFKPVGLNI